MANGDTRLPEGTDSIIGGASVGADAYDAGRISSRIDLSSTGGLSSTGAGHDAPAPQSQSATAARETLADARGAIGEKTGALRDQAADKAREYALLGKDRALDGLQNIQRLIEDAAATVDDKIGAQYGDYIRQAGQSVASLSERLEDKDVDALIGDARTLVRSNPGLAIGAAAAVGFLVARVAKAGFEPSAASSGGTTDASRGPRPVA